MCCTISDLLKIPGLYKVWLHTLKPPEKLSNEGHHIILQNTVVKVNRKTWQCQWSLFLKLQCSPLVPVVNTTCPLASDRSICSGTHWKIPLVTGCCKHCLLWREPLSDRYLQRARQQWSTLSMLLNVFLMRNILENVSCFCFLAES